MIWVRGPHLSEALGGCLVCLCLRPALPLGLRIRTFTTCLFSFNDPLFFKVDKLSAATFLIDAGAARSLFTVARVADQQLQPSILTSLQALGDRCVPILGWIEAQIDTGFSRLFGHEFCVCDMKYGILGADFLTRHKSIVDLATQILTDSIEVECPRYPRGTPRMIWVKNLSYRPIVRATI